MVKIPRCDALSKVQVLIILLILLTQGLFPVILGHEGGGIVSFVDASDSLCSLMVRSSP